MPLIRWAKAIGVLAEDVAPLVLTLVQRIGNAEDPRALAKRLLEVEAHLQSTEAILSRAGKL